jgi:hypothetical protein
MLGETRTLERKRGGCEVEKECESKAPLPTMIDEGLDDEGG